jgi:hypothetical protein
MPTHTRSPLNQCCACGEGLRDPCGLRHAFSASQPMRTSTACTSSRSGARLDEGRPLPLYVAEAEDSCSARIPEGRVEGISEPCRERSDALGAFRA